jgi:hypothetical protein
MKAIVLFLTLSLIGPVLMPTPSVEVCVSAEEAKLYRLIMTYRKSKGLKEIPISPALTQVAQAHVRDLEKYFDLENRDVCNPHSWSSKGKWKSCCYTNDHTQAECMWKKPKEIAGFEGHGYEIAYFNTLEATASEGLEGWKRSNAHNPVIINQGQWKQVTWNSIGVGIYGKYGVVWFAAEPDVKAVMKVCP